MSPLQPLRALLPKALEHCSKRAGLQGEAGCEGRVIDVSLSKTHFTSVPIPARTASVRLVSSTEEDKQILGFGGSEARNRNFCFERTGGLTNAGRRIGCR
jgi:hypothetical protein